VSHIILAKCGRSFSTLLNTITQLGSQDQTQTPAGTSLPPLVTKTQRAAMVLHLFDAGAQRPYLRDDAATPNQPESRPAADYLAWDKLIELTDGAEVVHALMKTGTRPDFSTDGDGPTPLAIAAATGNAGAVEVLKALLPPAPEPGPGERPWNIKLDAALAAAGAGHLAIAKSLVEPGMPFGQTGPRGVLNTHFDFKRLAIEETTLLHIAVRAGDAEWVRKLVALGAHIDGAEKKALVTPIGEALQAEQLKMAGLLLELGANPLRHSYSHASPMLEVIRLGKFEAVTFLQQCRSARRSW
jgi:ankyrin repeat protein